MASHPLFLSRKDTIRKTMTWLTIWSLGCDYVHQPQIHPIKLFRHAGIFPVPWVHNPTSGEQIYFQAHTLWANKNKRPPTQVLEILDLLLEISGKKEQQAGHSCRTKLQWFLHLNLNSRSNHQKMSHILSEHKAFNPFYVQLQMIFKWEAKKKEFGCLENLFHFGLLGRTPRRSSGCEKNRNPGCSGGWIDSAFESAGVVPKGLQTRFLWLSTAGKSWSQFSDNAVDINTTFPWGQRGEYLSVGQVRSCDDQGPASIQSSFMALTIRTQTTIVFKREPAFFHRTILLGRICFEHQNIIHAAVGNTHTRTHTFPPSRPCAHRNRYDRKVATGKSYNRLNVVT